MGRYGPKRMRTLHGQGSGRRPTRRVRVIFVAGCTTSLRKGCYCGLPNALTPIRNARARTRAPTICVLSIVTEYANPIGLFRNKKMTDSNYIHAFKKSSRKDAHVSNYFLCKSSAEFRTSKICMKHVNHRSRENNAHIRFNFERSPEQL